MRATLRMGIAASVLTVMVWAHAALAQAARSPLQGTSFSLGKGAAICSAQEDLAGRVGKSLFDRSWKLVCRDASRPIGQVHLLTAGESAASVETARVETLACEAPQDVAIADVGTAQQRACLSQTSGARWVSYRLIRGKRTYVAESVGAYDGAVRLALRSIMLDKAIDEELTTPVLSSEAGGSYYRIQAAQVDPATRLEQGYRSNNSGAFAEAVEYFDVTTADIDQQQALNARDKRLLEHDMLVNRALQLSNLGTFDQAEAAFAQAAAMGLTDPVQVRLARNLETIHRINHADLDGARAVLARPAPAAPPMDMSSGAAVIDEAMAQSLSVPARSRAQALAIAAKLSPAERAQVLDAQAIQLAGTVARLSGQHAAALADLDAAESKALAVRNGRVTAIYRLRSQILTEKAMALEGLGRLAEAEQRLRDALLLLNTEYPETVATQSATAALAAFLARHGRDNEALATYRSLIDSLTRNRSQLIGLTNRMAPYFELLTKRIGAEPALVGDLFAASQRLQRPGAASTLEQLSVELQGGNDKGAALFRQSIALRRDIERSLIQIAQLQSAADQGAANAPEIAQLRARVDELSAQQVATVDALAAYPQFRALSSGTVTVADMLASLKPGEAYFKVAQIGDAVYGIYLSPVRQTGWKLAVSAADLQSKVATLRDSISLDLNGVQTTYPFDVDTARALYLDLFGPVTSELAGVRHLVFEPDGPLLQLPVTLLIADQAGVDAYHARLEAADADEYDFRGIAWFGRDHDVSTSLSAGSFRDLRATQPSPASRAYLGLGHNLPVAAGTSNFQLTRGGGGTGSSVQCEWPLATWANPVSDGELRQASSLFGGNASALMTGAAFTDQAVLTSGDLSDFRILHFATHGLLAPPAPGCPARPALLTSFGTGASDGLLEFREIFDLRLNADLVILSACDTAGQASAEITREAGVETGGGTALDGLVRAFIGAGSRMVIASHWPAPDDYDATARLMTGLFDAPPGTSVGDALRLAQTKLMDEAATSHPFYWAGFALIGDGARPAPAAR